MRRLNVLFLVIFAGLFAWVLFLRPDTVAVIQRGAMRVFSPFIEASGKAGDTARSAGIRAPDRETLRIQLEETQRERDRLRLETRQLDEIVRENNALRRQLDYAERSTLELVPARVTSRKPETWYRTLIIDKGTDSGIRVDHPVIVPVGEDAGLVGKIAELRGGNTAVVLLLTDEICQVAARLDGTQEQGIVSGERGSLRSLPNLRLRYLSKEAKPDAGQKVITSGAGELFPPNLLVGTVIGSEVGALDAEAIVRPGVDFDGLANVFVILPEAR